MHNLVLDKPTVKLLKVTPTCLEAQMRQTIHVGETYQTPTPYIRDYLYPVLSLRTRRAISLPISLYGLFLVVYFTTCSVTLTCISSSTYAIVTFRKVQCKSELSTNTAKYTSLYEGIQFKSRIHHTGTWSTARWPPRRVCHRQAIVSHHTRPVTLWCPRRKILRYFKKCYNFNFVWLFKNRLNVKMNDLELRE
jgi:hypothetical protein